MAKLMLCCCVLVDACNVLVGFDDVKAADDVQQGIGPDTGQVLMQGWSNSMHASFNSVKINSLKRGHIFSFSSSCSLFPLTAVIVEQHLLEDASALFKLISKRFFSDDTTKMAKFVLISFK